MSTAFAVLLAAVFMQEHGAHGEPHRRKPETIIDRVRMQEASGTAWQPALTPMSALHSRHQEWEIMAHTAVFAAIDYQTGDRGEDAFFSTNWIMFQGRRPLGGGELSLRAMASAE